MEESKQRSMFLSSADSYIDTAAKVCQVFDGNEREEELDKLRDLMMDNWRDAHEFELEVEAQKEVDKRMELPDLDIETQYSQSLAKLRSTNTLPDPSQHEHYKKLEEAIQRALGQEMYKNNICGCQYKQEVVRQVIEGKGATRMRCPFADCANQKPLCKDDLECLGVLQPSSSSMRRSSSSKERKERTPRSK